MTHAAEIAKSPCQIEPKLNAVCSAPLPGPHHPIHHHHHLHSMAHRRRHLQYHFGQQEQELQLEGLGGKQEKQVNQKKPTNKGERGRNRHIIKVQ